MTSKMSSYKLFWWYLCQENYSPILPIFTIRIVNYSQLVFNAKACFVGLSHSPAAGDDSCARSIRPCPHAWSSPGPWSRRSAQKNAGKSSWILGCSATKMATKTYKNQKVWMKRSENTDLIPWFWMLISLKKDGFATYWHTVRKLELSDRDHKGPTSHQEVEI